MVRFSTCIFCLVVLMSALLTSCQKDENVKKLAVETGALTDSAKKLNSVTTPGNYLASKGILKIKIQDSTYTFDAARDSVAFVNINIDGEQYYGVTAINKAHSLSFGISSSGEPIIGMASYVSGAQFLKSTTGKKNQEYTLTHNVRPQDFGSISIEKYNQEAILAKGTFHTYLSDSDKSKSPFIVADGTFDLEIKQ